MKRHPKMEDGNLKAYWHEGERDLYFNHGNGVPKADAWLLYQHLDVLVKELGKRGYDLNTLRFSISKAKS